VFSEKQLGIGKSKLGNHFLRLCFAKNHWEKTKVNLLLRKTIYFCQFPIVFPKSKSEMEHLSFSFQEGREKNTHTAVVSTLRKLFPVTC